LTKTWVILGKNPQRTSDPGDSQKKGKYPRPGNKKKSDGGVWKGGLSKGGERGREGLLMIACQKERAAEGGARQGGYPGQSAKLYKAAVGRKLKERGRCRETRRSST